MNMVQSNHNPKGEIYLLGNDKIASILEEVAKLLTIQGANSFRIKAYHNAANTVRTSKRSMSEILASEGIEGLQRIKGIGKSLARSIQQLVESGRLNLLERLHGEMRPERVLTTISGIGKELASYIYEQLRIENLADLEAAVYDGRLARLPKFGQKRLQAIRESLTTRFHQYSYLKTMDYSHSSSNEPAVDELLDVDEEYRKKAQAGKLHLIAPRFFNPDKKAWLPILHTQRGDRHYTVLYSNTARAHEFGMTHGWVIIHRDDHEGDGQWTILTARFGLLVGRRIVCGHESECLEYYRRNKIPD